VNQNGCCSEDFPLSLNSKVYCCDCEVRGMSKLFESTVVNGMILPNRFVRSATYEGMATDDGACTAKLIDLVVDLVKGGVGLIITGHAYVRRDGQAGSWQLGVYKDDLIQGMKAMTEAVHEQGGKIVLQLAHAGIFADSDLTGQRSLKPLAMLLEGPSRQGSTGFRFIPPTVICSASSSRQFSIIVQMTMAEPFVTGRGLFWKCFR
jgi:2,4-dienoyl-CoA reductase-like NADH-dependent reductase (Old Yellow Enzyme family)